MKIIAEKKWCWRLVESKGQLFFSVVCGGAGVYELILPLSESETQKHNLEGDEYLEILSKDIQEHHEIYKERCLSSVPE